MKNLFAQKVSARTIEAGYAGIQHSLSIPRLLKPSTTHTPFHLWDLALCWKRSWKYAHVLSVPVHTGSLPIEDFFFSMLRGEEDVDIK